MSNSLSNREILESLFGFLVQSLSFFFKTVYFLQRVAAASSTEISASVIACQL